MKDFRDLKLKLFIGIVGAVLVAVLLGSRVAAGIYLMVVFGVLLTLYFKARSHAADPSFRLDVAGRSLLAVGNIALGMGLVLMGILAFREIGDLATNPSEMWHSLGFIVAPLLEGAATSTVASFLWDDLQAYGATLHPDVASPTPPNGAGAGHRAGHTCSASGLSTAGLQQQVDALKGALVDVVKTANGVQTEMTALARGFGGQQKDLNEGFKEVAKASKEQAAETKKLINTIRDMVADYQAFLTRPTI